ncbi:hypothetical protein ACSSS7_002209 [Eimeria intestinalis]
MLVRGRDGNVANIVFEQQPSGLVTASVDVGAVLTSGSAFAFAFALAFFLAAMAYCGVEFFAYKLAKRTRRCAFSRTMWNVNSFDDDRTPLYRYLEDRWPCALVATTSSAQGFLMLACCALSSIITAGEYRQVLMRALGGLEGVLGVLLMTNGWAFMLRLLHALSGASIFFLVLEKSIAAAVNEYGGIFVVMRSLHKRTTGWKITFFFVHPIRRTRTNLTRCSSVENCPRECLLLCLQPDAHSMVSLVNIAAARGFKERELRDNIEMRRGYMPRVEAGLVRCAFYLQELQARLRERREDNEPANAAKTDGLEEREAPVSQAEDSAVSEYRRLVLLFIPFIVFFAMAVCFMCDSPRVHREFEMSMAQIMQPFNTTDPFMTREEILRTPPVWMITKEGCNSISLTLPESEPKGIRRSLQITKVKSIGGVYDWLEQILAGQILNAAYSAPSTTNAIPLTNPGAVLVLSRVELECQTFDSQRLYAVPLYFSGMETPKTPMSRGITDSAAQVSDTYWTAGDYQAIYAGSSAIRTKVAELRSAKFLDWQMYQLDVLWMSYNGDSKMFVLNRVRFQLNRGGLETTIRVTVVPSWHVHPLESGIRPELVFLPLAVLFLLGYLLLSYRAVQKRRLNSFYLIVLDVPMAIAFACYCFFLLCMHNVAFDAGWSAEITSLTPGIPTPSTGNIPKIVPGPVQPWEWLPGSSSRYCVLGGSYNGFSSLANSVVSCVMITQAKWNFNSIITVSQQGQSIDWMFQVFTLTVSACFFGFMNYLVLSIVYVRYESLKTEEATEMQSALEAKYGVVQRKRLPLLVNDTVILYFKEYISKALLSTQIVRLQQFLTDIEFLRAKHYLILHDLGVIAEQMRVLRQVTRRQGKYVAGIEAAIEHVNRQIEEVQTRKAFVSYYNQQDPMHAKQQLQQQQLLDLGMDAGREHEAKKMRMKEVHARDSPQQQARADITPRVILAGMQDLSTAVGESRVRRRRGEAPWKALKPAAGPEPRAQRAGHGESDEEDDWDAVRQRFGGDRQGTLEIRQGDGNVLVVKPFPEPPADALPPAAISPPRRRVAESSLPPSEPEEESQEDEEAEADPAAAAEAARRVADFFATEEGPRPLTNAPEVAEQRAVDLATLRQRPVQTEPNKQGSRRASVLLPTFEAGGQDYRILPRQRGKRS